MRAPTPAAGMMAQQFTGEEDWPVCFEESIDKGTVVENQR
jgi:hypothetical protein